jgi:hypothetical protein
MVALTRDRTRTKKTKAGSDEAVVIKKWPKRASLQREFLSSFAMALGMSTIGIQKRVMIFFLWNYSSSSNKEVMNDDLIQLGLIFLNLQFFFGSFYAQKMQRNAANNPTVYALKFFLGEIKSVQAMALVFVQFVAHAIALAAYLCLHQIVQREELVPKGETVKANGTFYEAVLAEAFVAFANFVLFDIGQRHVSKKLQPAFGAFVYCLTISIEKCKYSCGYMNPAVVFAQNLVFGRDVFRTKYEIFEACSPYFCGAILGSFFTAIVSKSVTVFASTRKSINRKKETTKTAKKKKMKVITNSKSEDDEKPAMITKTLRKRK